MGQTTQCLRNITQSAPPASPGVKKRPSAARCTAEFGCCRRRMTKWFRQLGKGAPKIIRLLAQLNTRQGTGKRGALGSDVFRLEKKLSREGTCLTLDGDISTECIDVIETSCDEAMADGKPVDLFLREVITVDESGRTLLCRLAAKGVRLLANGVYASYLIEAANRTVSCRQ